MYGNARTLKTSYALGGRDKKLVDVKTLANALQISGRLAKSRLFTWVVILSPGTEPEARSPCKAWARWVRTAGKGAAVYGTVSYALCWCKGSFVTSRL